MFPENTHCHRDTEGRESDRQGASERDNEREGERERDYNVAANECQGMLYIFSHHASLNTRVCFLLFNTVSAPAQNMEPTSKKMEQGQK